MKHSLQVLGPPLFEEMELQDLEAEVKLPYIMKNKVLMSPGTWNGYFYSSDAIKDAFARTDWANKEVRSLFLDHEDRKSRDWIGEVMNVHIDGDTVLGDLYIVDKPSAMKLHYGAKMGISPKVSGNEDGNAMVKFLFDNMSVVINPAVKTAYINNSQKEAAEEPKKPYGDVEYADPGFRDNIKRYPLDTEAHVKAAWSYINMPKNREFYTKDQLGKIESKIKSAAKGFGITIKQNEEVKMENTTVEHSAIDMELESYAEFVKAYIKKNPGSSIKDAAGAYEKRKMSESIELSDIMAELAAIKSSLACKMDKPEVKMQEDDKEEEKKEDKEEEKAEPVEEKKEDPKEEDKEEKKEEKEMSATTIENSEKDKKIQELEVKLQEAEKKLSEPASRVTLRSEEMSSSETVDIDAQIMEHLRNIGPEE